MPPPTHIVTIPYRALRAFISWRSVAVKFCAGAAERMAERDGSAIDVDFFLVQVESPNDGEDLRGEGFV